LMGAAEVLLSTLRSGTPISNGLDHSTARTASAHSE
jgi:hypothetical protein